MLSLKKKFWRKTTEDAHTSIPRSHHVRTLPQFGSDPFFKNYYYFWFYPFFSQFGSQSHPYFFNYPPMLFRSTVPGSPEGSSDPESDTPFPSRILSPICCNSRSPRRLQCCNLSCWVLPPPLEWRANYVTPTWAIQTQPLAEAGFDWYRSWGHHRQPMFVCGGSMYVCIDTVRSYLRYPTRHVTQTDTATWWLLYIMFQAPLAYMLGFEPGEWNNAAQTLAPHPADPNASFYSLFVYSDILQYQFVGDSYVPLLRTVKIDGYYGHIITISYDRVHYIPVSKRHIENISVEIKTDQNRHINFTYGKVVLKLHFRQVKTFVWKNIRWQDIKPRWTQILLWVIMWIKSGVEWQDLQVHLCYTVELLGLYLDAAKNIASDVVTTAIGNRMSPNTDPSQNGSGLRFPDPIP